MRKLGGTQRRTLALSRVVIASDIVIEGSGYDPNVHNTASVSFADRFDPS